MFEPPFQYGAAWDRGQDAQHARVVVLAKDTNEKLFGGQNSVGRTVRLEDRDFRVVGVLAPWTPNIKFYDPTQNYLVPPENIFIPFGHVIPMKLRTFGNSDGWGPSPATPGFEGTLVSETCWIQMWVELNDAAAVSAYRSFLDAYALEQRKHGRFLRPLNNHVTNVRALMDDFRIVPKEANTLFIVSLLFLAVCALNLVGLLLGKFLARASEVGVRRALGASRFDIFVQHLVECELIALVGGFIGLALSIGTLAVLNTVVKVQGARPDFFFHLDVDMVGLSLVLSLAAGFVAGVYPAWRTCSFPAVHLKLS